MTYDTINNDVTMAGGVGAPQDDPVGRDDPIAPNIPRAKRTLRSNVARGVRREVTPPCQGLPESEVIRLLKPVAAALLAAQGGGGAWTARGLTAIFEAIGG